MLKPAQITKAFLNPHRLLRNRAEGPGMGQTVGQNAVLAYHEVMPESNYAYCVTTSAFTEHLQLFDACAKNGQGSPVVITFDDGEQSQLHNALAPLAKHGVSARDS